MEEHNLMAVAQ